MNREWFIGFSEVIIVNDVSFSFDTDPEKKTYVPIPAICMIEKGKDWRSYFIRVYLSNGTSIIQRYRHSYDADYTFGNMQRSIEEYYDFRG